MQNELDAFKHTPHKTLLFLALPALFSLIVEPLTGLADTAFISRLGSEALAALGVGTTALSSTFWVFNFLAVGAQTGVAQALGRGEHKAAQRLNGLSIAMALGLGSALIAFGYPLLTPLARLLGAEGAVLDGALAYMRIRLWGAPAVLLIMTALGSMRGRQDMRTPFYISLGVNGLNIGLDWPLIFGWGVFPALGIGGAAVATVASQWLGAITAVYLVIRHFGWPADLEWPLVGKLLKIGQDLFIRTGLLMLFFLLTTRAATQIGADSGAAHQAIRQVWILMALTLEAFAMTAQSLVGYFIGANQRKTAKQVASISSWWSMGTGILLGVLMWLMTDWVIVLFVPQTAVSVFRPAWLIAALFQPINAIAFVTDGIHWGTADYRYLRNGMFVATVTGALLLPLINTASPDALSLVWLVTAVWICVRAVFGFIRVWPGVGNSPFLLDTAR